MVGFRALTPAIFGSNPSRAAMDKQMEATEGKNKQTVVTLIVTVNYIRNLKMILEISFMIMKQNWNM